MDSPSQPVAPDPVKTAAAQATYNSQAAHETTALNRPNQITPYGSLTWSREAGDRTFNQARYDEAAANSSRGGQDGGQQWVPDGTGGEGGGYWKQGVSNPTAAPDRNDAQFYDDSPSAQWTSRVTLDPRVQSLVDAQLDTSSRMQGSIDNALEAVEKSQQVPYDYSSAPAMPTADDAARQRVEGAMYDRARSRMDPLWQQRENTTRSTLMNRGIVENSDAFRGGIDNFQRGRNDDYQQATWNSIINGGQEQSRLFNMGLAGRQQGVNEINAQHQLPVNTLNALRTGAQAQMPQFQNGSSGANVSPPNYQQAVQNGYQGDLNSYNAAVGSNNSMMGSVGQIGAAAMPILFSDRRLKRNIQRIATLSSGQPWYSFDYIWGESAQGVMADESPAAAIIRHPSGFDMVDYGKLGV